MQLHKFWGANRRAALSAEFSGHNLPEAGGPWLYERTVDLPEHDTETTGATSDEIIEAVERDGYYLLGADDADGNGARP